MTCTEAIREVFESESRILSTKDVISKIYANHPNKPWKESTISAHLIALSKNHPSAHYYGSTTSNAFLFWLGEGRYRKWNSATDKDTEARTKAPQRKASHEPSSARKAADPKDKEFFERLFAVVAFLDDARWEELQNYNLINFCCPDLSDDEKLLTHWLCYVTDRQMEFPRIWDVGGFVFSELVKDFGRKKTLDVLNPDRPTSYFIKRKDYEYRDEFFNEGAFEKHTFVAHSQANGNETLLDYDFEGDMKPYFVSRYYPSDYLSILYTLYVLQHYDFSFTRYIISLLDLIQDDPKPVSKLLFGLYILTYEGIGQPKHTDLNFTKNTAEAEKRYKRLQKVFADRALFDKEFDTFSGGVIFRQKRAWCSLRDFLKSPEFSRYFFDSLREHGYADASHLQSRDAHTQLELPGDVWNNNPKFRHCVLGETSFRKRKDSLSELLREIFDDLNITNGYPEQFDITFDLVPRMCDTNNCEICAIGMMSGKGSALDKVCVRDTTKYCPVVLAGCGYKIMCKGDACALMAVLNTKPAHQGA